MEESLATRSLPYWVVCVCACVLMVQIEPRIYTEILSLLVIESLRVRE